MEGNILEDGILHKWSEENSHVKKHARLFVNLGTGIGIGNGSEIGTDITNVVISSSIRPMDPKLSRVVTWIRGPHPQIHVTH